MTVNTNEKLSDFLEILGLDEEPMGLFFTDQKPDQGFSPKPIDLPTREKEKKNEIDWESVFSCFSCVMGNVWRARRKKTAAFFSAENFGCPGGAFWLGFNKPQTETIIHYVSTGKPGWMEGERYASSPDELRRFFETVDSVPPPKKYIVIKPISQFQENQQPELVHFFARPEVLCGLHQLAFFVSNDPEAVASPWSAGCGALVVWPLHYLARGKTRAVIGGWDPSARKYFKGDELYFTVPYQMYTQMLDQYDLSFLKGKSWPVVQKKIKQSNKVWGG